MNRTLHWLVGNPDQIMSAQESRASIALFLILAFCFNVLPPQFSFATVSEAASDGSAFNQIFWFSIFLLSMSFVFKRKPTNNHIFIKATPMLVLCLLLIISSLWSLAPAISLRRSILELMVVLSIIATISSLQRVEQAFYILYRVASFAYLCEILMLFSTNGFDDAGYFHGIHSQKNVLGLVCALSILVGIWVRKHANFKLVSWSTFYLIGFSILLLLSQSKTSITLLFAAPIIACVTRKLAQGLGVGLLMIVLGLLGLAYCIGAIAYISGVDVIGGIGDLVWNIGFTGRDDIWHFLIARFLERPWMGYGYGGFWDIGPTAPNLLFGTGYVTVINQAHNGYLDLLLAMGLVGLIAYGFVFIAFLIDFSKVDIRLDRSSLALCWTLVVFSGMHNFTESSLLRGYSFVWVVQLIAMAITYRLAQENSGKK